jgi:hypothetical protein
MDIIHLEKGLHELEVPDSRFEVDKVELAFDAIPLVVDEVEVRKVKD